MSRRIEQVHEECSRLLIALPGVVGTAIGACSGSPCIKVYVVSKTDDVVRGIPSSVEGYPLEAEETGEFRAR